MIYKNLELTVQFSAPMNTVKNPSTFSIIVQLTIGNDQPTCALFDAIAILIFDSF